MQKVEIKAGIDAKQFFPNSRHIIVYAFTIGERHYFRFDDPLSTGYDRALKTLVYYKEVDMNVDRDLVKAHTEAFDNALSQPSININTLIELKKLNDQLKQRCELPKEPDLMYKLASTVFFDQFENPDVYEFKYGENKIRFWKKDTKLQDFFFEQAVNGTNSIFAFCRRKYRNVFANDFKTHKRVFREFVEDVIGKTEGDLKKQVKLVAGSLNPALLSHLTIEDFYYNLDEILKQIIKDNMKAKRK